MKHGDSSNTGRENAKGTITRIIMNKNSKILYKKRIHHHSTAFFPPA
jgi:hypothetical protein